ncbi:hypothetical protein chiPu_0020576 [Chiloscyllium punctatum]|uniref:Uncharacterized protein n=1 Tax=Chiloscyllium punctatum TaxID=137246 RepID=A0A401RH45_CHIPU|nr:hypothetical protein [Chiloscyllium punctatum]
MACSHIPSNTSRWRLLGIAGNVPLEDFPSQEGQAVPCIQQRLWYRPLSQQSGISLSLCDHRSLFDLDSSLFPWLVSCFLSGLSFHLLSWVSYCLISILITLLVQFLPVPLRFSISNLCSL